MSAKWGAPLTGDEMKALKGRIDPETLVKPERWRGGLPYKVWDFNLGPYHLRANHPYYKARDTIAKAEGVTP